MAVGKSAVGRKLARRLKRRFVDLDKAIEKCEGLKVREIFERRGEPYFRQLEMQALAQVLRDDGQVIATGGGVVLHENNLRLLQERSLIVCLTADVNAIVRRTGSANRRPLLMTADKAQRINELLKQRKQYYARVHFKMETRD